METPDHTKPMLHGYEGDGELCVEICEATPDEATALLQLRRLGYDPEDWQVIGSGWCKPARENQWHSAEPGESGALRFWQLRTHEALE